MTHTVKNNKVGPRTKNRRASSVPTPPCCHYTRGAAQLKLIRKLVRSGSVASSCAHCRVDHRRGKSLSFLWVCLDCSNTFCGGSKKGASPSEPFGHARLHYTKDKHPWAVRLDNPCLSWCYICGSRTSASPTGMLPPPPPVPQEEEVEGEGEEEAVVDNDPGYVMRGMENTGNTCFLNAVLQNLLPIDSLRQRLYRYVGGHDRPITLAFGALFLETSPFAETSGVVASNALLVPISASYIQFVDRQQQDSHELLRCLLSGLETEGTLVHDIFAGEMTSTLCCRECGHASVAHESFLDLSLSMPLKMTPKKAAPPASWKGSMPRKRIKFQDDSTAAQHSLNSGVSTAAQRGSNSQLRDCSDDGLLVSSQLNNSCRCLIPVPCTVDSSVILLPFKDSDYKSTKWLNAVGEGMDVFPSSGGGSGLNRDEVDNTNSSFRHSDMDSQTKDFYADLDIYSEPRWEENSCRALIPFPSIDDNGVILLPLGEWGAVGPEWLNTASPCHQSLQNMASVDATVEAANMPQATPGLNTENAVGQATALAGNSDSCQDEVDNTDSPVSTNSCLELFTQVKKPQNVASVDALVEAANLLQVTPVPKIENAVDEETALAGNSDSCQDEVDNSDSPVCINSCLEFFTKVKKLQNVASVDAPVEAANMPRVTPVPKTENAVGEETALAGNSDLCQDEVDNTDSPVSINSCLELFTKEEFLPEDAWHCEHCSKNDLYGVGRDGVKSTDWKIKRGATKRILINRIPLILTIHLKRFRQEDNGHLTKLNGHVDFSEELDMGPFMDPRSLDKDKCQYKLTGLVVHSGSLCTGHYIAYVRREKGQGKKQKSSSPAWFYASDAVVREAPLSEVLSSDAYILFYERVQT